MKKYNVLFVSLLSTLATPYGGAAAMDTEHQTPITNSHPGTKHEATRQEQADTALSLLNDLVGGDKSVNIIERLQALTETLDWRATSLEEAVNNISTLLSGISGMDLIEKITHLTQEKGKDEATNRGLKRLIDAMKQEQAETNVLLDQVIEQHLPTIPQPSTLHEPQPPTHSSSSLSSYQEGLLARKSQIGEQTWNLLGGENVKLAAALSGSIQQNPGKVDILSLETNSFTLRVNGKEQYHPYRF